MNGTPAGTGPGSSLTTSRSSGLSRSLGAASRSLVEELTREVRRLRAAELTLRRQKRSAEQANQRMSASLAMTSHELRTPLHGILGYLELLESDVGGPLQPGQEGPIERIRKATEHLSSVIETSLTYSALEARSLYPQWEETDATRVALEALELVQPAAAEKRLHLHFEQPPESVTLRTDPGKLRQILVNLLSNAIKFTDKGLVTLALRQRPMSQVSFVIRDTGVGIREKDLPLIFDPFWRGPAGVASGPTGTGLGLTVTRDLCRLLGGNIKVRSSHGRGSAFTVRLPPAPRSCSRTREAQ